MSSRSTRCPFPLCLGRQTAALPLAIGHSFKPTDANDGPVRILLLFNPLLWLCELAKTTGCPIFFKFVTVSVHEFGKLPDSYGKAGHAELI